jgi:hypothetical protein
MSSRHDCVIVSHLSDVPASSRGTALHVGKDRGGGGYLVQVDSGMLIPAIDGTTHPKGAILGT